MLLLGFSLELHVLHIQIILGELTLQYIFFCPLNIELLFLKNISQPNPIVYYQQCSKNK